jgi:asparagine synthase (glutamine-hydrolysing)
MSALAGRWNRDGRPDAGADCARMLAAQAIYGPHGTRQWDDGAVAIGRCLYETLPEDAFDRQPLAGGGGRWHMVADVRLDNRDELAAALAIDERAMSDAAVLLAAWERWEDAVFAQLLGDYAFAVWDARDRRLVLARDALGARPLHYHVGHDFVAFASMPKGLHALPDIPYAPDAERVAELLVFLPEYGSRSFFAGIQRVESGQVVTLAGNGAATVRRHWNPSSATLSRADPRDYGAGLRAELDRAVGARLRGGAGRVGAHLSGGLDSAAVAATAARLTAPGGRIPGGTVIAFTSVPRAGYDGPDPARRLGDEGPLAAATAALYPTIEHVLVRPDGRGPLEDFDGHFHLFERPVLNPCNQQWITAINVAARDRGLRVMLTGAMGNMSLSYGGVEYLPELFAAGRWLRLLREGRALVKAGSHRWRGVLVGAIGPWLPERLWRALHRMIGRASPSVTDYSAIDPGRYAELDLAGRAAAQSLDTAHRPRKSAFETRLWVLRRADTGNYNKGVLAGWGIDQRDPTADRRLVEYCLSLPMEAYLADGEMRVLAKRALADRLPAAVLAERRKGLQAIDWHEGLTASRDDLRREIARLAKIPAAAATLDLARMQRLVEDWPESGWERREISSAYRLALLRGAAAGHFLRKALRGNA